MTMSREKCTIKVMKVYISEERIKTTINLVDITGLIEGKTLEGV